MKHRNRPSEHNGIVQELAVEAIRGGADMIEVEYDEGYEEVYIRKDNIALGIDRFNASSPGRLYCEMISTIWRKRSGESLLTKKRMSCTHVSMIALGRMRSESSYANSSVRR